MEYLEVLAKLYRQGYHSYNGDLARCHVLNKIESTKETMLCPKCKTTLVTTPQDHNARLNFLATHKKCRLS